MNPNEPKTELAGPTEIFYMRLGEEIVNRNIQTLNEVLRQLLTLSVGLAGGGAVFLSDDLCSKGLKIAAVIMFGLAMIASFVGVMPYREDVPMSMPCEIKASFERAIGWKDGFIYGAAVFIFLGFALALVGILAK